MSRDDAIATLRYLGIPETDIPAALITSHGYAVAKVTTTHLWVTVRFWDDGVMSSVTQRVENEAFEVLEWLGY